MIDIKLAICLIIFPLILSCTYTAKIKLVNHEFVEKIPLYSNKPGFYQKYSMKIWNSYYKEGFYAITISSDLDLGAVVQKNNMHVLYYRVFICGEQKSFFSGPVFPMSNNDLLADTTTGRKKHLHYYMAYLPINYKSDSDFAPNYNPKDLLSVIQENGVCLKIGAADMIGSSLSSNTLNVEFLKKLQ